MTVNTSNLNRGARFVVKHSVAVRVLAKMTVDAVHPFFQMNIVEMDSLSESIRIVRRNYCVPGVQQIPFSIAFEHLTKDPTVSVKVGKLGALQLGIEFRRAGLVKKFLFGPEPAEARRFGIAIEFSLRFRLRRIMLLR